MKKKINKINFYNLLASNNILESGIFSLKIFSFFIKKYDLNLSYYDFRKIIKCLNRVHYIIQKVNKMGGNILFIGMKDTDFEGFEKFNSILKSIALSEGHIYCDEPFEGVFYDYWSLSRRNREIENFALKLQKNKTVPDILFIFSKDIEEYTLREFSKSGIPIIYFLEGFSNYSFKDFPLFGGVFSYKLLNFYLDFLQYSIKKKNV